jgi:hypothetical protein
MLILLIIGTGKQINKLKKNIVSRYRWPCGLRRMSWPFGYWDRGVRIPLGAWMFVSCV